LSGAREAPFWHREGADVVLAVHVQAGAHREGIAGIHDGRLKIAVSAPARDGSANARLLAWLAEQCGVAIRQVELVHGSNSRIKRIRIRQAPPSLGRLFARWGASP
jgi:hypothetical protein